MNIVGRIVTLRAIEREDLEFLKDMLNDPAIEDVVVGWAFPISAYQQECWYERSFDDDRNLRFIIETPEDGAVGLATLTNIDWKNRSAFHGIKIASRENRTRGIGTDAVMAIMRYAFDELQLNRLDGNWFPENSASQRLYTKCGWKVEGLKKRCVYKKGQYRDLAVVGILADEYRALIEKNHYWSE